MALPYKATVYCLADKTTPPWLRASVARARSSWQLLQSLAYQFTVNLWLSKQHLQA